MKKGFSGSSPQPVQLELAIERTFSMLYLLTIEAGFPLNNLTLPTKRLFFVLLTLQPVLLRPLLRTIMKEFEGLLIAFESEALDHTNSLWPTSPTRRDILEAKKAVKTLLRFQSQFRKVPSCSRTKVAFLPGN